MNHIPMDDAASEPLHQTSTKKPRSWLLIALLIVIAGPMVSVMAIVVLLGVVAAIGASADDIPSRMVSDAAPMARNSEQTHGLTPALSRTQFERTPTVSGTKLVLFDGRRMELKFVGGDEANGMVNEYIPEGETLENWTTMLAVRYQPIPADPATVATQVAEVIRESNPNAPYATWGGRDGLSSGIDFVTWQGDITEFNIFIYTASADGSGIISYQYAERAYGSDPNSFVNEVHDRREALIRQTARFPFPKLVRQMPSA